jgi:hypothetical protein
MVSLDDGVALMRDPATHRLAELIPTFTEGGRPRMHRRWQYVLAHELAGRLHGFAATLRELAAPRIQRVVRRLARELFPPEEQPSGQPMLWHHLKYTLHTYMDQPAYRAARERIVEVEGSGLSRDAGNFSGEGPAATIHPTQANTTAADGKVIASRSKARPGDRRRDRATGKRIKRPVDPGKRQYHEGDGNVAWGHKEVLVHTKSPFGWVVLGCRHVEGTSPKEEADVAVEILRGIRPMLPGPHFHVNDGAMTSEHNQVLQTELDIVLVNRPRAKRNPKEKGRAIGQREPRETLVERKVISRLDGTDEVLLIYESDANWRLLELDDNGEPARTETGEYSFLPLKVAKRYNNENKHPDPDKGIGRFRPYVGLRLPAAVRARTGMRVISVATYQTAEDQDRGYLRTARVRTVAPESKDFDIYRQMRGDSESLNRWVEDCLYRSHRAYRKGWDRNHSDTLGIAGLINALTRERMRRARLLEAA